MPPEQTPIRPRPARVLTLAFLAVIGCSGYVAGTLLFARCEGFGCTYLGMAWLFWLTVLCLPATVLGYFAQRSRGVSARCARVLWVIWCTHNLLSVGLLAWWLLHRM